LIERWQRIGDLFDRALTAAPHEREALLQNAPEPDDIKSEVRSLLAAHDSAGDFLETGPKADMPALAPGAHLGTYHIVRVIGRGGMGVVYEAEDTRLHRRVALKALPPDVAADERQRQRLRQEARAAAALQHPGIATVYALEEFEEQLFISTEYLAGETLRDELRRGPLSPDAAVAAGIELARALCAAHERGVIHRDLKPENIVRTTDGHLKVLDFGLAQFEGNVDDTVSKPRLTLTGMVAGTPAYMSPEQLLGHPTDFRVDHFALGIVLYELCTGTHPFAAESLPSTIARILAAAPEGPPPSVQIPASLWTVIERCLQKEPAQRFSSTRELLGALSTPAMLSGPGAGISPGAVSTPAAHASSLLWWRFHQLTAALAYWAMVWPAWHVHRSLGRFGLFFFFAVLSAVVIAGSLRLHLWFSSRVYPQDLPRQRDETRLWIRAADVTFAAVLLGGGIALPDTQAGWAALLISFAVGASVAFVFVEPATARAAFRHSSDD
jgi:hypothetical protein